MSSAFDGEGLASRRTPLIQDGVLQGFLHASWSARKAKTASTASATRGYSSTPSESPRALALSAGSLTDDELLRSVGDAVFVQSMSGLHSGVNPISGDFSTGADGLRISGGSLGAPIKEFTIASTLQRMLHDVTAVGSDLTWLPMSAAGVTLVVADVTVSGS
jgi:PmbA protein